MPGVVAAIGGAFAGGSALSAVMSVLSFATKFMGGDEATAVDTMVEGASLRNDSSAANNFGSIDVAYGDGGNAVMNDYMSDLNDLQAEFTGAGAIGAQSSVIDGASVGKDGAALDTGNGAAERTNARGLDASIGAEAMAANGAGMGKLEGDPAYGAGGRFNIAANNQYGSAEFDPETDVDPNAAPLGAAPQGVLANAAAPNDPYGASGDPNLTGSYPGITPAQASKFSMTDSTFQPYQQTPEDLATSGNSNLMIGKGAPPGQQVAQQGNAGMGGTGNRYQLQQRQMPASFQQQGKGGIDMGAALKAMAGLAASRKKEQEKRMIPGASARTWQQGYPGAPGMPGAVPPPGAPQGMLGQVAMGGQQVYSPRPTFQRPLVPRRPVTV